MRKHLPVFTGLAAWLGFMTWRWPQPQGVDWIVAMLIFSPLVLMPLAVPLVGTWPGPGRGWSGLACGFAMLMSFFLPSGKPAAVLVLPWLGLRALIAISACIQFWRRRVFAPHEWCLLLAEALPTAGAAWLFAHRLGWNVSGFDALTILLTAAHFHHAAFTLPLLAGWAARQRTDRLSKFACIAILIGVLEVPAGIAFAHFKHALWLEMLGVIVLASGAIALGVHQVRLVGDARLSKVTRLTLILSGISLIAAMLLAGAYGLRAMFPESAPLMPQMWAIHGTLNAVGFGLLGVCAWRVQGRFEERATDDIGFSPVEK
jgi:hypothetical protein